MGSSQSTRRISIDNDSDPSSVIKITDSVVERLKGTAETEKTEEPQPQVRKLNIAPSDNVQPIVGDVQYYPHPYITSHQMQQEIAKEVKKNTDYWEKRVANILESQEKMNRIMETEYNKKLEEMEKALPRLLVKNGKLPCQDKKAVVVKCYKLNSKQPLLCSKEVEAFANCMTNMRIQLQEQGKLS